VAEASLQEAGHETGGVCASEIEVAFCHGVTLTRPRGMRVAWQASPGCVTPTTRRRRCTQSRSRRVAAAGGEKPNNDSFSNNTKLRSEVQAPFRVLRQFLLGALGASATVGGGVATIQLVTGALGAPSAPPLAGSAQNVAIDGAVLAVCLFFYRKEEEARGRQMARIDREEQLARLRVELTNGKTTRLSALRGFARVVLVAGPQSFVEAASLAAEPYKKELLARAVVFVPYVTDSAERLLKGEAASDADKRWRVDPIYKEEWQRWLQSQMSAASVTSGSGVYVSLRMDGRVRASGVGPPPWALLASSLPPTSGVFGGWLDGMDGSVQAD
jgi:hypothetical protein